MSIGEILNGLRVLGATTTKVGGVVREAIANPSIVADVISKVDNYSQRAGDNLAKKAPVTAQALRALLGLEVQSVIDNPTAVKEIINGGGNLAGASANRTRIIVKSAEFQGKQAALQAEKNRLAQQLEGLADLQGFTNTQATAGDTPSVFEKFKSVLTTENSQAFPDIFKNLEVANGVEIPSPNPQATLASLREELQNQGSDKQIAAATALIDRVQALVKNNDPFLANYRDGSVQEALEATRKAIQDQNSKEIFNAAGGLLEIVQQAQKSEIETKLAPLEQLFQEAISEGSTFKIQSLNTQIQALKAQL